MSFAFKIINKEKKVEECLPLFEESKYEKQREELLDLLKPLEEATETGLIVDESKCTGCANCIVVCPVHAAEDPYGAGIGYGIKMENPILRVEDGVVKVENLKICRRYGKNRILCVACRENCPTDAITFLEG